MERERERQKDRQTDRQKHLLAASRTHPSWGSNLPHFSAWANAPTNRATSQGCRLGLCNATLTPSKCSYPILFLPVMNIMALISVRFRGHASSPAQLQPGLCVCDVVRVICRDTRKTIIQAFRLNGIIFLGSKLETNEVNKTFLN